MYEEKRYEYTIRTCSIDDSQELEEILNQMAHSGWELYSLNEAENEEGEYQYLCIFSRHVNGNYQFENDYIVNAGDFKATMNKLMHKKDDLYKECRYLQQQIREKNLQINNIKNLLDSSSENVDREGLNREISERMTELNTLKSKFSELLSPVAMYSRINQNLLTIVVSYELAELIDSEKDGDLIAESVKLRQKLAEKLGYVIPRIHFTISDEMNENEYGINVRRLKSLTGLVYPGHKRFFPGQSNLDNIPGNATEDIDPITGRQVFWLDQGETKNFWDGGLTPSQVITSHMEYIVCKYVDEILCYKDVISYISVLEEENAFLVEDLLQGELSLGDLRRLLAGLLRERVSVRDIVYIFEKLNDITKQDYEKDKLPEKLRLALKRQICGGIADNTNTIFAVSIPKKYKNTLYAAIKNKNYNENEFDELVKYLSNAFQNSPEAVLIAEPQYRKSFFDLLEREIPGITVISEDEIAEEFTVEEV